MRYGRALILLKLERGSLLNLWAQPRKGLRFVDYQDAF